MMIDGKLIGFLFLVASPFVLLWVAKIIGYGIGYGIPAGRDAYHKKCMKESEKHGG